MSRNFEVLVKIRQDLGEPEITSPSDLFRIPEMNDQKIERSEPVMAPHLEVTKLIHLLFLSSSHPLRRVVFCGIDNEEGSAAVSGAVAKAVAKQGSSRVCLVDVSLSNSFALTESQPAELLSAARDDRRGVHHVGKNLWFTSTRRLGCYDGSCTGAAKISESLLNLQKEFEFLLVHAPPLGQGAIASVVGQVTDGIVLVLEANATRRVAARCAKQTLEAANVRILGAVLNNRRFPIPEKFYRLL